MKKQKDFSQEDFDKLLNLLDPIREEAERKYEDIYQRLIVFFEYNKCLTPEECADETVDRVIKKIKEGTKITTSPPNFFHGVARFVLLECQKEKKLEPIENVPSTKLCTDAPDELLEKEAERKMSEKRLECLERCMQKLQPDERYLILEYYPEETNGRIEKRKVLAEKLGIPNGALRIRALRIRGELQKCIEDCLK